MFSLFNVVVPLLIASVTALPTPREPLSSQQQVITAVSNIFLDIAQINGAISELLNRKNPIDKTTIIDLARIALSCTLDADIQRNKLFVLSGGEGTVTSPNPGEDASLSVLCVTETEDNKNPLSTYNFIIDNPTDISHVQDNLLAKAHDINSNLVKQVTILANAAYQKVNLPTDAPTIEVLKVPQSD
ncbi:hypothetical protein GLAREA_00091 [Glarea lozoyensis ATCC 20868]|uniref:Uncharacterized protein n=1 Tax=Glarea lozoyensis (strain ATCC 20868 / MF5171) TaxID=1116229 RepID=S3DR42_GLAL2|nr:uncharacterized protein GLAREA_00091 [Glarea lozoyensis ATCC 20868]EPE28933.1 hypothetical protein GLAREA_00091 [Glarea lozoyensis ATCC 20868]